MDGRFLEFLIQVCFTLINSGPRKLKMVSLVEVNKIRKKKQRGREKLNIVHVSANGDIIPTLQFELSTALPPFLIYLVGRCKQKMIKDRKKAISGF